MKPDARTRYLWWQPLSSQARIVAGLLTVSAAMSIVGIIGVATAPAPTDITFPLSDVSPEVQRALGGGSAGLQGLSFLFSLGLIITWLMWQHRAQSDLHARGVPGLEYTPGWCVGWWFIPGANFVMPYLCMRELFGRAGVAAGDPTVNRDWRIAAWWLTYVGSAVLGLVGGVPVIRAIVSSAGSDVSRPGELTTVSVTAEAIRTARAWAIAGRVSAIAAAGLAIWIVWTISTREDGAFGATTGLPTFEGAVPPRPDLW
jgi:hypothetical protein